MTELTAEEIRVLAEDTLGTWFPRYTEYDQKQLSQWRIVALGQGRYRFEAPPVSLGEPGLKVRVFTITISVSEQAVDEQYR